jgi:hypothetical protein
MYLAAVKVRTEQEVQQVLAVTVAQQHAFSDGVSSLTKQRRRIRANAHHLEQLGHGQEQGNVELIPPGKDRSDRSDILYFPNGYKEVQGPFLHHHERLNTPSTGGDHQAQKPGKARTPI